jgi:tetratricopeptide (TPR) repeat protein
LLIAREKNLREQIAFTLGTMMLIYFNDNQITKGQSLLEEVQAIWNELDNQPMLADSYSMAGFSYMMAGDYKSALESYSELERISRESNNTWNLNISQVFFGFCYLQTGEISRGMSYLEEAIKLAEQSGLDSNSVMALVMLADGYAQMGEEMFPLNRPLLLGIVSAIYTRCGALSKAQDVLSEMVDFDRNIGNRWFASYIIGAEAELALANDKPGEAIDIVEPHIPQLIEAGVHATLPYLLYIQGQAHLALDDLENALPLFQKALRESERTGERYWRWKILLALIGMATGGDPELLDLNNQWQGMAAETINFIDDSISDPKLRKTFIGRSEISAPIRSSTNR